MEKDTKKELLNPTNKFCEIDSYEYKEYISLLTKLSKETNCPSLCSHPACYCFLKYHQKAKHTLDHQSFILCPREYLSEPQLKDIASKSNKLQGTVFEKIRAKPAPSFQKQDKVANNVAEKVADKVADRVAEKVADKVADKVVDKGANKADMAADKTDEENKHSNPGNLGSKNIPNNPVNTFSNSNSESDQLEKVTKVLYLAILFSFQLQHTSLKNYLAAKKSAETEENKSQSATSTTSTAVNDSMMKLLMEIKNSGTDTNALLEVT